MQLCANLSLLFTDLPLPDRVAAAARAGFDTVEVQFPAPEDTAPLKAAATSAGVPVTLINIPRVPDALFGLAALPGRTDDFAAMLDQALGQAQQLGVAKVNVLAGCPPQGSDPAACLDTLCTNLRRAAEAFAALGVQVVVEPINLVDVPGFFLNGLEPALAALARADHPNLALQFDFYHMSITEPDLVAAIHRAGPQIGHVQFADAPGRHAPGSGAIDFVAVFEALRATGYDGVVSAEYRPEGATGATLDWMPRFRELMG